MRYTPIYSRSVVEPEETRQAPCRECVPSRLATPDGRPWMLSTVKGRFDQGLHHPPCEGCPALPVRERRYKPKRASVRLGDRARILVR